MPATKHIFRLRSAFTPLLAGSMLCTSAMTAIAQIDTSTWETAQDHANMMQQLGITRLRPGKAGFPEPGDPNAANSDEALANIYPDYPDLLTLKNGTPVTTAQQWTQQRRPEIVEDFEREVIGRLPANIPEVTWQVVEETAPGTSVADIPVTGRKLIGVVDNSGYPDISVEIEMSVVLPVNASGPVPVLMMFGRSSLPGDAQPVRPGPQDDFYKDIPPSTEQLIAAGWGYAQINPGSIQADNGTGLTKGIIGLVNKGQPRKPEDWGSLRAWAWGAARGLDYLETLPEVDASRVGIEGVSRYGKAALVTQAFEPRFAIALVGSSGEGGASPYRRNFGESVENLTGGGEYHWMAGNFLKYGAAESSFGEWDANNLPVDAHSLIALTAPKLTFISYGIPERGDALWLDQQGSYMATVAASRVYELLGVKGLPDTNNYKEALMPPVNVGLVSGQLAWRQHNGGHEDRSNMKYFLEWANTQFDYHPD